jgi:hypothetical protein
LAPEKAISGERRFYVRASTEGCAREVRLCVIIRPCWRGKCGRKCERDNGDSRMRQPPSRGRNKREATEQLNDVNQNVNQKSRSRIFTHVDECVRRCPINARCRPMHNVRNGSKADTSLPRRHLARDAEPQRLGDPHNRTYDRRRLLRG